MNESLATGRRPALVALVGNRNVGKSTLFNGLTGLHQKEANYPGVTVFGHEGMIHREDGQEARVLDLPGTNSLVARAPDEEVVVNTLLGQGSGPGRPDLVVAVLDATQARRGLFLLSQILDCGLPVLVCLNMVDDANREGIELDAPSLSAALGGLRVVETVASRKEGLQQLEAALFEELPPAASEGLPRYPEIAGLPDPSPRRWNILRSAAEDPCLAKLEVEARWRWVDSVVAHLGGRKLLARRQRSDHIDRYLLHPVLGPLIFLVVMGLLFQAVFAFATPLMDGITQGMSSLGLALSSALPSGLLRDFLVDGVLSGVGAVLVFLPQILILFLFLGLLEDSGYMTRAAFIADAPLRKIGLSGRSFIPLLSSFACAIPGILAARSIEDRRERLLTIMVAPLMTCSARLPIYSILIGTFIPPRLVLGFLNLQGLVLLSLYLGGMFLAALAALLIDRFLRSGRTLSILELPPYRLPRLAVIAQRLRQRTMSFLKRAGTIILAMTVLLWVLLAFPRQEQMPGVSAAVQAQNQISESYAGSVGHLIEPLIEPLGYDWRLGVGLVSSLAAREVFVSTMAVVYAVGSDDDAAMATALRHARRDDNGQPIYDLPCVLSLLAFYMAALQCVSTIAVVRRETGSWKFVLLQFAWMTTLAWGLAWLVYTTARACL